MYISIAPEGRRPISVVYKWILELQFRASSSHRKLADKWERRIAITELLINWYYVFDCQVTVTLCIDHKLINMTVWHGHINAAQCPSRRSEITFQLLTTNVGLGHLLAKMVKNVSKWGLSVFSAYDLTPYLIHMCNLDVRLQRIHCGIILSHYNILSSLTASFDGLTLANA